MPHIRIISPSGAIDPHLIDLASTRLQEWGFVVTEGRYTRSHYGRFAATDEQRLSDLMDALTDSTVDAILCARGGYGLQRLLPDIHVRIEKPIIGFSDITALHQLAALHHQPTLHSIMCKHLATLPEESETLALTRQALTSLLQASPMPSFSPSGVLQASPMPSFSRPGTATGTLIGGNLSVLYGLQGTPYSLTHVIDHLDNAPILFIEDIAERHYHIDRMMRNLKMSGVLERISGLVVGQFTDCDEDPGMNETIHETIYAAVREYTYPVLFDYPAGHTERNLPLLLNTTYTLCVDPKK